jgi:hypothetical protein
VRLTTSMTVRLGDTLQGGLGERCAMMDSPREGALFGVVVASTVRKTKITDIFILKFWSVVRWR